MKHKADPALRIKPNSSNRSTATTSISLSLASFTVIALYFFWHMDNQGHRIQVQLMQIDSTINLANGLEWKAVYDGQVSSLEMREIFGSLQSMHDIFEKLDPGVRSLPEIANLHRLSMKYADSLTRELFLISTGHLNEAHDVDQREVAPTLNELHAGLVAANKAQGRRASAASRIQFAGSVSVVLISFSLILLLSQRARLAAETSNRVKGEFLANMSHEIRTPINGVLGMAELLIGTELTVEQREYALMLKSSGDSLLGVINDILDFSKIESGKLRLDPIAFELHRTMEEVSHSFALKAHEKNLEIILEIGSDVPEHVTGDPTRLRQILVNLIGNAIKFTHEGEILIAVQCNKRFNQEFEVQFTVSDSGIGIAPEKQLMIFEAFAQADSGTTRQYGGTGLGLAISAQLTGLMGGRIWVESAIGDGSAFCFTVQFGAATGPQTVATTCPRTELLHLPVLIVDDNPTNRRILVEMTHGWAMEPTEAESGSDALGLMMRAKQGGNTFRLALIDGHMPGMDGFELAEQIKHNADLSGATVMMLTSSEYHGDAARCEKLGIAAYLVKPVRKSELLLAILKVLGRQPVSPPELAIQATLKTRPSLRVLVAEDNTINQVLIVRLLERWDTFP